MKRTTELKRKTPLKSKGATKKKRPAHPCCWSNRCKTRAPVVLSETERYCKSHAKVKADETVGAWVKFQRDLRCVSCGDDTDRHGPPNWAHIRSRGATTIRWYVGPDTDRPGNSVRLCAPCHQNFTLKPAAWDRFVEARWPGQWTRLVHLEIERLRLGDSVDVAAVIKDFRARLAAAA